MEIISLTVVAVACLLAWGPNGYAQQWNQYSVTNGNVTTHTYMNPQTGAPAPPFFPDLRLKKPVKSSIA
jgi:hypothetical protein